MATRSSEFASLLFVDDEVGADFRKVLEGSGYSKKSFTV